MMPGPEEPEPEQPPELPPQLAVGTAVILAAAAGLLQLMMTITLIGFGFPLGYAVLGMSAVVTYGVLFGMLAQRLPDPPGRELGLVGAPWSGWLAALLLIGSAIATSELDNWTRALFPLPETDPAQPLDRGPTASFAEIVLVQMVVFPLVFEFFFRGALQPTLERALGPTRGIALSGLLSALAYAMGLPNPRALPTEFVNGLLAGLLRHVTGSLRPALFFHVGLGALRVGAHYQAFEIPGFDDMASDHTPTHWVMYSLALAGAGLWLCRRAQRDAASLRSAEAERQESSASD